jgi:predicted MFS family arabinose efflux permease
MTSFSRTAWVGRVSRAPRELLLFAAASLVMGMAFSMFDSTFNNFLNDRFALSGFERSFLEFPRELPGFLVVFVSAALGFLCTRRLGTLALVLGVAGALLIAFLSRGYWIMVIWLFVYSLGQHLFMPVASTIGMELAREGRTGQRLGQLNAIRNVAVILGSFSVILGFNFLGFTFQHVFVLAAVALAVAAALMFAMRPNTGQPPATFMKLHKEYRLFYALAVLSGSRKQLFITFAPWVLVSVFGQPVQILATLMTIGAVIGIVFQPLLGWMIDRFGERVVLSTEAVLLVFVCAGYGFSRSLFPEHTAFLIVCGCYLFDQMLISVGMARSTYIKKIAREKADIQPALTVSVTIDHVFSIGAALAGGLIWNAFGFQFVFMMGAVIALLNLFVARRVRVPEIEVPGGNN